MRICITITSVLGFPALSTSSAGSRTSLASTNLTTSLTRQNPTISLSNGGGRGASLQFLPNLYHLCACNEKTGTRRTPRSPSLGLAGDVANIHLSGYCLPPTSYLYSLSFGIVRYHSKLRFPPRMLYRIFIVGFDQW